LDSPKRLSGQWGYFVPDNNARRRYPKSSGNSAENAAPRRVARSPHPLLAGSLGNSESRT
jgi:hypothetical protein